MKLTAGILLVYTQDEIFWQNKQCKKKTPYSRQVLLVFLSSREETELMDALKCWTKSKLFQCVIQQQFFKVGNFWIQGNLCTILIYQKVRKLQSHNIDLLRGRILSSIHTLTELLPNTSEHLFESFNEHLNRQNILKLKIPK